MVAGDGSDDRLLVPGASGPLAWRPGEGFELAYADRHGRVVLVDAETGRALWRTLRDGPIVELEWSSNGRRLVARRVRARDDLAVYTARGALFTGFRTEGAITSAATRPHSHARAVAVLTDRQSQLFMPDVRGSALSGPGAFEHLAWSADGGWLVVGWPMADQWVFVRAGGERIRAVSNVSEQFRSGSFPRIEGWIASD
jgi:hypothetical protein